VSADPLTVHGLGADPNLYAYVSGRALQSIDPLGLTPPSSPLDWVLRKAGAGETTRAVATAVVHFANPSQAVADRIARGSVETSTAVKNRDAVGAVTAVASTVRDVSGAGTATVEGVIRDAIAPAEAASAATQLALGGNKDKHIATLVRVGSGQAQKALGVGAGLAGAGQFAPRAPTTAPPSGLQRAMARAVEGGPAAWLDGYMAELEVHGGGSRIPLSRLESPKTAIPADARYMRAKEGVAAGETPPIEVEPTGRGGYRIQDGVRRSVAARELGHGDINATVREPTPGAPQTVPLNDVKLEK
jgi:hypothetical protein